LFLAYFVGKIAIRQGTIGRFLPRDARGDLPVPSAKRKPLVGAVIQARLGSSRLPGKVLRPLAGWPLLAHVIERLRQCRRLDRLVLATSTSADDAALVRFAKRAQIGWFAGSEDDVLARFLGAAEKYDLDVVVRICSDSPLIDWVTIDRMIETVLAREADYSICNETYRHACEGFEVVTTAALRRSAELTAEAMYREHVTLFIRRHPQLFRVFYQPVAPSLRGPYRMSVDVAADYEFMQRLYEALYQPRKPIDLRAAVRWLKRHPEVLAINAHVEQKAPDALTRRAVVLVGETTLRGRAGQRLRRVARDLAENHHCVITLAGPILVDALEAYAEPGWRVASLTPEVLADPARLLAFIRETEAKLVVVAGGLLPLPASMSLADAKFVCLPLDAPPTLFGQTLDDLYQK
jgi:spore coat polysaccharide biosynthesis protein SpsF